MAPPVVKDVNGKVVEEFGDTEKNFFFTKTGRPGYNDTKEQRYTLTIDKDGNITVYSRPKASGLPTVPSPASKIGTYSTDGKFTKSKNTNPGELEYFSNKENYNDNDFQIWKKRWQERLLKNNNKPEKYMKLMRSVNPLVIPRNRMVEEVLMEANNGKTDPLNKLLAVLNSPYSEQKNISRYQTYSDSNEKYQTFCGT